MMVRAKAKAESVADVEAAARTMFSAIEEPSLEACARRPAGYPTV
jgi:hypothetical protein